MDYFSDYMKPTETNNSFARCLLVIPEMHEHVIFQHYHDSLLGAHYGPLNTLYTI